MSVRIAYDPELNLAMLVGSDPPVALGPVADGDPGEDPRLVLEEFVSMLGEPADQWPSWKLYDEWRSYVDAISQLADQELARMEAEGEQPDADVAAAIQQGAQEPPTAPVPAGEAGGEQDGVLDSETDGSALGIMADPNLIRDTPGTPAKRGVEECWMCKGELQIDGPAGKTECPVCKGTGETPISEGRVS